MPKSERPKSANSIRGGRFKKQGSQTGGSGYNEKIDGKNHGTRDTQ